MAIINNQTTQNGDVLYIETTIPAIGLTSLIGFIDVTEGEGITTYTKSFQYSTNGVTWSDWLPLTLANVQSIQVVPTDTFFVKYRYKQKGQGILKFDENKITGQYLPSSLEECPYYFNESIFKNYFSCNDIRVLTWYINVTEKLYSGELNKYLKFDNGVNGDETDAISFWQSIGKFFAFYVVLARIYKNFYLNEDLINEYLIERGLFTKENSFLSEYNLLMKNFYNEINKRGTKNILNKKNNTNLYDGELLRYLNIGVNDPFLFNYYLPQHCGWWIDNSSPMYRGLEEHMNANYLPYDNYIYYGGSTGEVSPTDKNDVVLKCSGADSGIKYDNLSVDKLINININNNYILEFDIKVLSPTTEISLGVDCFTTNGATISESTVNFKTGVSSNVFVTDLLLNRYSNFDEFFKIKCVIFNKNKPLFTQDVLNIGVGNNLKFVNNDLITKLYPNIKISGDVEIKNLYIRPLYTNYERGFIHINHFVSIDYTNKSSV